MVASELLRRRQVCRVLSVDVGSLNFYDYAGQDPINSYDLDGTIFSSFAMEGLTFGSSFARGEGPGAGSAPNVADALALHTAVGAVKNYVAKHKVEFAVGAAALVIAVAAPYAAPEVIMAIRMSPTAVRIAEAADAARQAEELVGPGQSDRVVNTARVLGVMKSLLSDKAPPSITQIRRFLGQPMKGSGSWPGFWP
jgi:hypothetical protein